MQQGVSNRSIWVGSAVASRWNPLSAVSIEYSTAPRLAWFQNDPRVQGGKGFFMKEQGGIFLKLLRLLRKTIPGTHLKTFVYLHLVYGTRKFLRSSLTGFYRMDHVYEVIREFKNFYKGTFSILEFGVADGYAFTKKLYATRFLGMEDRIRVHGFDTFEGLPEASHPSDAALVKGESWVRGHYHGRYEDLLRYCRDHYRNFQLHKGLFEETITDDFLESLKACPPILVWIDCDYYASARVIFERIIPFVPTGCVFYFDDIYFNFSSRFTGEMKLVWELNHGDFGDGIELVPDTELSWSSNRIFRFVNMNQKSPYELRDPIRKDPVRRRNDDSPLP